MTTQTTSAKIILPNNTGKSSVIMTPTDWNVPEGYELIQQPSGQHVLRDSLGRVNITYIFNQAVATDPTLKSRSPYEWLKLLGTKELRSNYQDLFGFDPVNTIKGGKRIIKPDDTYFGNYHNINVSTNGNVQTYGTYMLDRMFSTYAQWVSFQFKIFIDDLLDKHNFAGTEGWLVSTNDELGKENASVNSRYRDFLRFNKHVPANCHQAHPMDKDVQSYVALLRSGFNINISTTQYLEWLTQRGLFHRSYLEIPSDVFLQYKPNPTFLGTFFTELLAVDTEGESNVMYSITDVCHLRTIQELKETFPLLTE